MMQRPPQENAARNCPAELCSAPASREEQRLPIRSRIREPARPDRHPAGLVPPAAHRADTRRPDPPNPPEPSEGHRESWTEATGYLGRDFPRHTRVGNRGASSRPLHRPRTRQAAPEVDGRRTGGGDPACGRNSCYRPKARTVRTLPCLGTSYRTSPSEYSCVAIARPGPLRHIPARTGPRRLLLQASGASPEAPLASEQDDHVGHSSGSRLPARRSWNISRPIV